MNPIRSLSCAALAAAFVPLAAAQTGATKSPEKPTTTTVQVKKQKLVRTADFLGKDVNTPKGTNLGSVSEVVVEPHGEIAFLVVQLAGSLNAGSKLVPIPWDAVRAADDGTLVVDVETDDLAKGHGWSKDKWPRLDDRKLWDDMDKVWARQKKANAGTVEAAAKLAEGQQLYRLTEFEHRPIESPEGGKLATIDDAVVDRDAGRISFVVLQIGEAMGAGAKLVAVPWQSVRIMPDKENPRDSRLTLATTKEQLESAPEFVGTAEGWAKALEPDYVLRVYEHYSVPAYWKVEAKPVEKKSE